MTTAIVYNVSELATVITDAAKGTIKAARAFRALAEPAYGDLAIQGQVAECLTSVRREVLANQETYCKWLASHGQAAMVTDYKRSLVNQLAYASKVAGQAAGCKFEWDKVKKLYRVADLPAANETPADSAAGKDTNAASQAADVIAAAAAAPELSKADRAAKLDGAIVALVNAGFTFPEIEAAIHGLAARMAASAADADANAANLEPKAPAVLAEKLQAAGTTDNGIKVKAPRQRKAG